MADGDDDAPISTDERNSFLMSVRDIEGADFPLASGINVTRLASALIGSLVFEIAVGVNTVILALSTAYSSLIDGVTAFVAGRTEWVPTRDGLGVARETTDGLIQVTIGLGVSAIEGAWAFSLDQFGIFAYPVGVGVLLASLYVVDRGITAGWGVLNG